MSSFLAADQDAWTALEGLGGLPRGAVVLPSARRRRRERQSMLTREGSCAVVWFQSHVRRILD